MAVCCLSRSMPSAANGCAWHLAKVLVIWTRRKTCADADVVWRAPSSREWYGRPVLLKGQTESSSGAVQAAGVRAVRFSQPSFCPPSWAVMSPYRAGLWVRDRRFQVSSSLAYSHGSSERRVLWSTCPCSTPWKTILTVPLKCGSGLARSSGPA
jgi:hypothetical protein